MTPVSHLLSLSASVLVAGVLAGCAASTPRHDSHSHSMMDMKAMCEHHKQMMAGKSPAEHQAMMNDHMKSSSTAEMQKHMQMMQEQCR